MYTADAARIIGITPRQLRSFLRSQGTYAGSGSRYEFSHEEVVELSTQYWGHQPPKMQWSHDDQDEFVGTAGLPTQWLRDQTHEAEFVAERQSRLERMSKRLREVGLSVPQMTERDLTINMRALASAMLKGEFA
jgi:hypothetical protein